MSDDEIPTDTAAGERTDRWTVKSVPLRSRLLAMSCARRAGKPAGQWLAAAIDIAAERQGQGAIVPPPPPPPQTESALLDQLARLAQVAAAATPLGRDSKPLRAIRAILTDQTLALRASMPAIPGRRPLGLPPPTTPRS